MKGEQLLPFLYFGYIMLYGNYQLNLVVITTIKELQMKKFLASIALAVVALTASQASMAWGRCYGPCGGYGYHYGYHSHWLGHAIVGGVVAGAVAGAMAPPPVYVQPAPVYAPPPVYVQPAPVYVQPAPAYYYRGY
jgi:hypothetical protein